MQDSARYLFAISDLIFILRSIIFSRRPPPPRLPPPPPPRDPPPRDILEEPRLELERALLPLPPPRPLPPLRPPHPRETSRLRARSELARPPPRKLPLLPPFPRPALPKERSPA